MLRRQGGRGSRAALLLCLVLGEVVSFDGSTVVSARPAHVKENGKSKNVVKIKPHHDAPHVRMQKKASTSTIIFVKGCTGSTWLAELLEKHPCVGSFIPPGAGPDHHFKTRGGWTTLLGVLDRDRRNSKRRSSGVLVQDYIDELDKSLLAKSANPLFKELTPRIMIFEREALFGALCTLKKHALGHYVIDHHVKCANVNHQSHNCAIASDFRYTLSYGELKRVLEARDSDWQRTVAQAESIASKLEELYGAPAGSRFMKLTYAELVCAQSQLGGGRLPIHVEQFLGISPEQCPEANFTQLNTNHVMLHGTVKTTPRNSLSAVSNKASLFEAARAESMDWAEGLTSPSEARCVPIEASNDSTNSSANIISPKMLVETLNSEPKVEMTLGSSAQEGNGQDVVAEADLSEVMPNSNSLALHPPFETPPIRAAAGNATATIIFVHGCTGSTWLAEVLEKHPCTGSFIPSGAGPDHHFKPGGGLENTLGVLAKEHQKLPGKSSGFLVQDVSGEWGKRLIQDIGKASKSKANTVLLGHLRPRVLLFQREPLFSALCTLKKHALAHYAADHHVECANVNHQSHNCAIATDFKYSLQLIDLKSTLNMREAQWRRISANANAIANKLGHLYGAPDGSNFLDLSYAELVCAQKHLGFGRLPIHVEQFLGISPEQCPEANFTTLDAENAAAHGTAKKTSPPNSALGVANYHKLFEATRAENLSWAEGFMRPSEVVCA